MKLMLAAILAAAQLTAQSPEVSGLLASSAADFKAHSQPVSDVRHVRVGEYGAKSGDPHLLFCGEVLLAGASAWLPFATIKTSGYEQWLGGSSATYCEGDDTTWQADLDLTSAMKRDLGLE